jgi:hypothetical protein
MIETSGTYHSLSPSQDQARREIDGSVARHVDNAVVLSFVLRTELLRILAHLKLGRTEIVPAKSLHRQFSSCCMQAGGIRTPPVSGSSPTASPSSSSSSSSVPSSSSSRWGATGMTWFDISVRCIYTWGSVTYSLLVGHLGNLLLVREEDDFCRNVRIDLAQSAPHRGEVLLCRDLDRFLLSEMYLVSRSSVMMGART